MKKILFGFLSLLFSISPVLAQDKAVAGGMPGFAPSMESQSMTYVIRDDGTAHAWLRVDGLQIQKEGGKYEYTLPAKATGTAQAWYKENGCRQYNGDICLYYGGSEWQEAKMTQTDKTITVTIPPRTVSARDLYVPLTVGISYATTDLTTKKWWGREVTIVTGKTNHNISYLNIGVYLPDGVYARDKQQGPSGWGEALNTIMVSRTAVADQKSSFAASSPSVFDYVGGGEINRGRNNLFPGEDYTFTFMSSNSLWKLFYQELLTSALWIGGIAVVVALLLFMLIGKKSVWWYGGVMLLLLTLMILIGGLWMSYRFNFGSRGGIYPAVMKDAIGRSSTNGTEPQTLVAPAETPVEAPSETAAPEGK